MCFAVMSLNNWILSVKQTTIGTKSLNKLYKLVCESVEEDLGGRAAF